MADTPESRFVEDFGLAMSNMGLPRMPARVCALMLAAPEDGLTARELAERLQVSPAAISGAVRYLVQIGLVRRTRRTGERVDRYSFGEEVWEPMIQAEIAAYGPLTKLCDEAVSKRSLNPRAQERVAETRDFLAFMADELPGMVQRWRARRGS